MAQATRPKSRRRSRGALFIIAALLASSGALRLTNGTGHAIARELQPLLYGDRNDLELTLLPGGPAIDDGLDALLAALNIREVRLNEEEAEFNRRVQVFERRAAKHEAAFTTAREQINENLAALTAAETALEQTINYASTAAEDDLKKLTAVYENMKPKSAAALFEEMSPEFSAGFLGRMRADAAAAILAGMSSERAYSVSVILAGRNATIPKQ